MTAPLAYDRPVEDLSTRARIRDAAMFEFGEKGFKGATMKSIAETAGVSVGLVQHHFGTKDGLRAACDESVLDLVRMKTAMVGDRTITDPRSLSALMAMAPRVQHYVGRALVEDSSAMVEMVDEVMGLTERFLTDFFPDRFVPGSEKTRNVAAVMAALNTSTMILQSHVARRMDVEPFSRDGLTKIGSATLDAWETVARFTDSDFWKDLRSAIDFQLVRNEEEDHV